MNRITLTLPCGDPMTFPQTVEGCREVYYAIAGHLHCDARTIDEESHMAAAAAAGWCELAAAGESYGDRRLLPGLTITITEE